MNSILIQGAIYLVSFILVWIGAGFVVSSISRIAKSWNLPTFTLSFFLLGVLTSLPEIAVGTQAILNNDPQIFVGNLIGGVFVLFFLIIPALALLGSGVKIPKQLSQKNIFLTLTVVVAPALVAIDRQLTVWDGVLLLLLYIILFVFIFKEQSLLQKINLSLKQKRKHGVRDVLKVVFGVLLLWGGSNQIIRSTVYFSELLHVSQFLMSLIVVSFGTNIPEFSIIFRSLLQKKQDVALADYLGSAAINTPLLGILIIFSVTPISLPNHFFSRFLILVMGLILFFFFSKSDKRLSKPESLLLLFCYAAFVFLELSSATSEW